MSTPRLVVRRALVAATVATLAGCGVPTESRWQRDGGPPGSGLSVESSNVVHRIEEAPVSASTELTARVLPAVETVVTAPAAGRISRLTSTGSEVAADENVVKIVVELDEREELRIAILELELQLAELEGRTADAEAAAQKIAEIRARPDSESVLVTSPVSGVLGRFLVERSVRAEVGDPIFTVGDPSALRVEVEVDDARLDDLVLGTRLRVIDAQNRFSDPTPAVVTAVEPLVVEGVTESTGRWLITASIESNGSLVVGDRVLVDVQVSTSAVSRRVAVEALLDDGNGKFVLVVDDAGSWRRVDVDVGLISNDFVEILTDIDIGTQVVVP